MRPDRLERLLALLYTDAAARERFYADRPRTAKEAGLTEAETESLLRLDAQELEMAARVFTHKRSRRGP